MIIDNQKSLHEYNGSFEVLIGIFDQIQSQLNVIFNLKDKLLKANKRFNKEALEIIIRGLFPANVLSNHFSNCILLNKPVSYYDEFLHSDFTDYSLTLFEPSNLFQCEINDKEMKCKNVFLAMIMSLFENLFHHHRKLIESAYDNEFNIKKENVNKGILEIYTVYFCMMSLLYGLRFFNKNKLIFYVQPYYLQEFYDGIPYCDSLLRTLDMFPEQWKELDIVISFRLCDPKYATTDDSLHNTSGSGTLCYIKSIELFKQVYISRVSNFNFTEKELEYFKDRGVIFDDDVDDFNYIVKDDPSSFCVF